MVLLSQQKLQKITEKKEILKIVKYRGKILSWLLFQKWICLNMVLW